MTQSQAILARLEARGRTELSAAWFAALTAQAKGLPATAEWEEFTKTMTRVLVLSHLAGRLGVVNAVRVKTAQEQPFRRHEFATYAESPNLLTGPFVSAINWFMGKVPNVGRLADTLLPAARSRAFWVTGVESAEALAGIQQKLAKPLAAEGGGLSEFIHSQAATGLAEARLETVFRTNLQGALAGGQRDQMLSPEMRSAVALMQLNEVHDKRTRGAPGTDNPGKHWQMDGFVEAPDHPIWERITPPNGYNCRGGLSPITWLTAERAGWAKDGKLIQAAIDKANAKRWEIINAGEYPDPNFK